MTTNMDTPAVLPTWLFEWDKVSFIGKTLIKKSRSVENGSFFLMVFNCRQLFFSRHRKDVVYPDVDSSKNIMGCAIGS